ncbi:PGL/p-HBAD biosynthesis glycosyltransferase/MT3031 [Candidatus Rubidus massiliensis]|nr:PGL/p-HBAD biosynthesis glycosyltransferase/MT3031 [Candidatus Rubidus massiliensis]
MKVNSITPQILSNNNTPQNLKVSIIIPSHNTSHALPITLDHIFLQSYQNFEVIVIDALSTDSTFSLINEYPKDKIKVITVPEHNYYKMLNKGISEATGDYINCLFPGDYYLSMYTLQEIMAYCQKMSLVYCGTFIRNNLSENKTLLRVLSNDHLKKGLQPTSIEACFFHMSLFDLYGKFNEHYYYRGGFDYLCRISKKDIEVVQINKILLDSDFRKLSRRVIAKRLLETFKILNKHFGLKVAIHWFFTQKDLSRIFWITVSHIKSYFLGNR